jgi:hypothetical protein
MLATSVVTGLVSGGALALSIYSNRTVQNLREAKSLGDFFEGDISSTDVQELNDNGLKYRVVGSCTKSLELTENSKNLVTSSGQIVASATTQKEKVVNQTQRYFWGKIFLTDRDGKDTCQIDPSMYSLIPFETLVSRFTPGGGGGSTNVNVNVVQVNSDHSSSIGNNGRGSNSGRGGNSRSGLASSSSNKKMETKESSRVMGATTNIEGCRDGMRLTMVSLGGKSLVSGSGSGNSNSDSSLFRRPTGSSSGEQGQPKEYRMVAAGTYSVVSPKSMDRLISDAEGVAEITRNVGLASGAVSVITGIAGITQRG